MRWFFCAPKTYVQTDGLENIYNFTLKNFVYLKRTWIYAADLKGRQHFQDKT